MGTKTSPFQSNAVKYGNALWDPDSKLHDDKSDKMPKKKQAPKAKPKSKSKVKKGKK